mmetsp:Transcript_62385/g.167349  ORF Transcript_62385/g.167349 Transcript_62385/m.167349 type:complete len:84 (+) Transcript_62385:222-473(+)
MLDSKCMLSHAFDTAMMALAYLGALNFELCLSLASRIWLLRFLSDMDADCSPSIALIPEIIFNNGPKDTGYFQSMRDYIANKT